MHTLVPCWIGAGADNHGGPGRKVVIKPYTEQEFRALRQGTPDTPACVVFPCRKCLAVDWVEGSDLWSKCPSTADLVESIPGFIRCMANIHNKGVLHCDIAASNAVFDKSTLALKPIDFANARFSWNYADVSGLRMRYRAPEVLVHADRYNAKAEQYAIGRMLLEELTRSVTGVKLSLIPSMLARYPRDNPPVGVPQAIWSALRLMSHWDLGYRYADLEQAATQIRIYADGIKENALKQEQAAISQPYSDKEGVGFVSPRSGEWISSGRIVDVTEQGHRS